MTLSTEPDEVLAERAKRESAAFAVLYERHVRRIYNYIYMRTGSVAEAEDLTARTFFQALSHLERYEVRSAPFAAWLFRIAHNLVANWHRDTSRHPAVSLESLAQQEHPHDDPEEAALSAEEKRELRAAIARLPADRQLLLLLKFGEERSNAEIAQILGRSEGAVKALLHRTLVSLRAMLQPDRRSPGQPSRAETRSHPVGEEYGKGEDDA